MLTKKNVFPKNKKIDIGTKEISLKLKQFFKGKTRSEIHDFYLEKSFIHSYLKKSKTSELVCGDYYLYTTYGMFELGEYCDQSCLVVKKRCVAMFPNYIFETANILNRESLDFEKYIGAVIISSPPNNEKISSSFKSIFLLNADQDDEINTYPTISMVEYFGSDGHPTISFKCVDLLLKKEKSYKRFINGGLTLVDYTVDETIHLDEKELKLYEAGKFKELSPPEIGFTLMHKIWHRPSTCLVKDNKTQKHYIFGQDEGSYFGCELPRNASNIKDAFLALTPKEVLEKRYDRQGEWFIIEVPESDIPNLQDRLFEFGNEKTGVNDIDYGHLPIQDEESNFHILSDVRHGMIAKNGQIYVKGGLLVHDQHETINFGNKWHTFYCNNAIRSVSVEGVD